MRVVLPLVVLLFTGCSLESSPIVPSPAEGDAAMDSAVPDVAVDVPSPSDAMDATTPIDDAGSDVGDVAPDRPMLCDPTPCPGRRCNEAGCLHYASCDALHSALPSEPSGEYEIDPDGAGALSVYCDMIVGGGWTLIMKLSGHETTFDYDDSDWTNTSLLREDSLDLSEEEAKLDTYLRLPLTELRLGMTVSGTTRWVTVSATATSMHELMNGPFQPTAIGRTAWESLVPSPQLQNRCGREGFNNEAGSLRTRIGIFGNNENDCSSPDSFIGFGSNAPFETCDNRFDTIVGNGSTCDGRADVHAFGYILGR